MKEKKGGDVDELYADLAWLLAALEQDKDVTDGPRVVRAAMQYIEARVHVKQSSAFVQLAANDPSFGFTERERQRILDEELSKVEISTESGANPVGKLIKVNERVEERMSEQVIGDYVVRSSLTMPPATTIRNVPLERVVENAEPKEIFPTLMEHDVPVSQLLTGDSVFSESAGTWHDVRIDGQALYLKRGESWVAMSHLPRDTVFRTRRGASGRAAGALFDNFGGEVIRDER